MLTALCDEIAKRVLSFSRSCLLSDNDTVRFVSGYSVWYGRMSPPFASNVFHCCVRYCADVDDVWCVTLAYILQSWASKGTPGDAKCVTEILGGGQKIRKLGGQSLAFCFKGK